MWLSHWQYYWKKHTNKKFQPVQTLGCRNPTVSYLHLWLERPSNLKLTHWASHFLTWFCPYFGVVVTSLKPVRASYHPVGSLPSSPPASWLGGHSEKHPVSLNSTAQPDALCTQQPLLYLILTSHYSGQACLESPSPPSPQLHPTNTTCSLSQQQPPPRAQPLMRMLMTRLH